MVMKTAHCKIWHKITILCVSLWLTLPSFVQAQESFTPAIEFKGQYIFAYDGIGFGKMGIEASQTARHYAITSDVASTGIINLFTTHTSHTTVEGIGKDFNYPAIVYETHYQTKKKPRYVKIVHAGGIITEETALPPDAPQKRPPVPAGLKKDATDPLSFLLTMRQALHEAQTAGHTCFQITLYDGRRLTGVDFTIIGKKPIRYQGKNITALEIDARRKQLAGFTQSETDSFDPKEATLRIYFSDDDRLVPILLQANVFFGTLSATLTKECGGAENCLLGNKE
jgi:hypothetical protein